MDLAPRVRRLSAVLVVLAFFLQAVPAAVGSPVRGCFGYRVGSDQCGLMGLGLMVAAGIGIALTQSTLPIAARRWTLAKALIVAFAFVVLPTRLL